MAFGGNPNVTITAINVSGGIVCSRTSGQTPCFVHVSASAITATGTSIPYEDLEFSWNFGDQNGTEIFQQPVDGTGLRFNSISVNANTSQTGPEAAYVYRSSGTFTVTLQILGKNGGSFTNTSVQQNISVSDFSASGGDWYFDSAAPGGGDGSIGLPFNSVPTMNTKLGTANTRINIKRGSVFTGSTGLVIGKSNTRINDYGTGGAPQINIISGSSPGVSLDNNLASIDDVVISDIDFSASGSASASNLIDISATFDGTFVLSNIYLDNCNAVSSIGVLNLMQYQPGINVDGQSINAGVWGGVYVNTVATGVTIGTVAQKWGFVVGATVYGDGTNATLDHHIYPNIQEHGLFRYIEFGLGTNRNYCINTNFDRFGASLETAQYFCLSDNDFTGLPRAFDASNGNNDPSQVQFTNFVAQRNVIHNLTGNGVVLFNCAITMTFRDNLVWGCTNDDFFRPGSGLASLFVGRLYRNMIYRPVGGSIGTDTAIWNYNTATFTQLQTITDNVIQDIRGTANVAQLSFVAQSGAAINRNQYYVPNDSTFMYDGLTEKSFAQWQAAGFDASGIVANPGWLMPTEGDFRSVTSGSDLFIPVFSFLGGQIVVDSNMRGF